MLNIDELNVLNSYANEQDKQTCNNYIDMWREDGLLTGYFGAKCNELYRKRRVTYNDILELYIYYCFVMYETDVSDFEQKTFRDLADFYYKEGQQEVGEKPKEITDAIFYNLMKTPSANGYNLYEYKWSKALNSTYQIHRQAVMQIQQGNKASVKPMDKELEKEQNERLKIATVLLASGLTAYKISGVIDMIAIGINNMAKVEGIKEATKEIQKERKKEEQKQEPEIEPLPDVKVKFVAVKDNRTTPMCKSLDGQIFNLYGKNTFTRWSNQDQANKTYTCDGLVLGLNLPPITNHFHWCRSTITYNIDEPNAELTATYDDLMYKAKKLDIQLPDTLEGFSYKWNNVDGFKEEIETKQKIYPSYARQVKTNDKVPFKRFYENYLQAQEIGEITANDGIKIEKIQPHTLYDLAKNKLTVNDFKDILENGISRDDVEHNRILYTLDSKVYVAVKNTDAHSVEIIKD